MRILSLVVIILVGSLTFNVSARQVCTDIGESNELRDQGQQVLSDRSVVFKNPEVLVSSSQYLPLANDLASVVAFCGAHGLNIRSSNAGYPTYLFTRKWGGSAVAHLRLERDVLTAIKNEKNGDRRVQFTLDVDPNSAFLSSVTCSPL